MNSLLEGLARQLDPDTISRLSREIGADPATTSNAIGMALPVLVGGLANNASTPEGASALNAALARDHDGSLLDDIAGAFLGGGTGAGPKALDGAGILEHIFGGRRETVETGIERSTGLGRGQVLRLLLMLAPIVMAYLGRRRNEQGLDAGGMRTELEQERERMEQQAPGIGGLFGQLMDQNGDGSVADDLLRMAPGVLGGLFGGRR